MLIRLTSNSYSTLYPTRTSGSILIVIRSSIVKLQITSRKDDHSSRLLTLSSSVILVRKEWFRSTSLHPTAQLPRTFHQPRLHSAKSFANNTIAHDARAPVLYSE
jgi:hypothetical protein